jgi:hypothetical protein
MQKEEELANSEDPDPVRMQSKKQASINFVPN